MERDLGIGAERIELLHFAPEHSVTERLAALENVRPTTTDVDPGGVDVAADITALPFEDESFDAIICSHVLEHVEDDAAAMRELARVLRPGGWAVVMVPLDHTRAATLEDAAVTAPEDREQRFLQHDHVRLYAYDLADRLADAGFEVSADRIADAFSAEAVRRHGLLAEEVVFCCTRPAEGRP